MSKSKWFIQAFVSAILAAALPCYIGVVDKSAFMLIIAAFFFIVTMAIGTFFWFLIKGIKKDPQKEVEHDFRPITP